MGYDHLWTINDHVWTIYDHTWTINDHTWTMYDHIWSPREHTWTIYDHIRSTYVDLFPGMDFDLMEKQFSLSSDKAFILMTFGSGNAPTN